MWIVGQFYRASKKSSSPHISGYPRKLCSVRIWKVFCLGGPKQSVDWMSLCLVFQHLVFRVRGEEKRAGVKRAVLRTPPNAPYRKRCLWDGLRFPWLCSWKCLLCQVYEVLMGQTLMGPSTRITCADQSSPSKLLPAFCTISRSIVGLLLLKLSCTKSVESVLM